MISVNQIIKLTATIAGGILVLGTTSLYAKPIAAGPDVVDLSGAKTLTLRNLEFAGVEGVLPRDLYQALETRDVNSDLLADKRKPRGGHGHGGHGGHRPHGRRPHPHRPHPHGPHPHRPHGPGPRVKGPTASPSDSNSGADTTTTAPDTTATDTSAGGDDTSAAPGASDTASDTAGAGATDADTGADAAGY